MSAATRTDAEKSRSVQLAKMTVRPMVTASSSNLVRLDLSCLPIETRFRAAFLEDDGKQLQLNDDLGETLMALAIPSIEGTLRQTKWETVRYTDGGDETIGMTVRFGPRSEHRFTFTHDGVPYALWRNARKVMRHSSIDCEGERRDVVSTTGRRIVIPQHLLRFPATFYGRADVSFLGLPKGTTLPLKNGGMFEVNCRTNVVVESDGAVSGHLHLIAKDDKASKLAELLGWGKQTLLGVDGFLAPPNLYTSLSSGRSFDTAGIRLPWRNPLEDMLAIYPAGVGRKYPDSESSVAAFGRAMKGKWAGSPEELAAGLDDFLFG